MIRATLTSLCLATLVAAVPAPASACDKETGTCPSHNVTAEAVKAGDVNAVPAAARSTVTFAVSGMTCGGCAKKLSAALMGLSGVGASTVDHQAGKAVVTFDKGKVDEAALQKAITDLGYTASVAPHKS